jgi:hypothetical protein
MLTLTDTQKDDLGVTFTDAKGNPALVDGAPAWSVSDPTILSVTPTADGMGATIAALGPLGSCQVSVTADADMGGDVKALVGTLDVSVVAGAAVSANISAGAPTEQ